MVHIAWGASGAPSGPSARLLAPREAAVYQVVFVNLPVADLRRSREFFAGLGYRFDNRFCDGDALCLVLGRGLYAMLLRREVFAAFTPFPVPDPGTSSEVTVGLGATERDDVDRVVDSALASGGVEVRDPLVHGDHLYARAYADLDGHVWELMWMAATGSSAA